MHKQDALQHDLMYAKQQERRYAEELERLSPDESQDVPRKIAAITHQFYIREVERLTAALDQPAEAARLSPLIYLQPTEQALLPVRLDGDAILLAGCRLTANQARQLAVQLAAFADDLDRDQQARQWSQDVYASYTS